MRLIYVGAALVIGGAAMMLVSYYGGGPTVATDLGKTLALLGFVVYVAGRIRYRRRKETGLQQDSPYDKDES